MGSGPRLALYLLPAEHKLDGDAIRFGYVPGVTHVWG